MEISTMEILTFSNGKDTFMANDEKFIGVEVKVDGASNKYEGKIFKVNSRKTAIGFVGYSIEDVDKIDEISIKTKDIENFYWPVIKQDQKDLIDYLTKTAKAKDQLTAQMKVYKTTLNWIENMSKEISENFASYDRGPGVESKSFQVFPESKYGYISFSNGKEFFESEPRDIAAIKFIDISGVEWAMVGEIYKSDETSSVINTVGYFEGAPDELQVLEIEKNEVVSVERRLLSAQLKQILNLHAEMLIAKEKDEARYAEAKSELKSIKERERKIKFILKA